jgi:hypothetical protein
MKNVIILSLCFLPLFTIWLVMKLSVWIATVNMEQKYVRDDAKRPHGPYVEDPYGDSDEEGEDY